MKQPGTHREASERGALDRVRRLACTSTLLALTLLAPAPAPPPPPPQPPHPFPPPLDQTAFFYRTFPVPRTNTAPLINWQPGRGVPISTNALDPGSAGRAPPPAQQFPYATNYPPPPATPG